MFSRSFKRVSEPATRDDLEQATTQLRGEMKTMGEDLRGEMKTMGEELRGEIGQLRDDMKAMEARLQRYIGEASSHAANVMMENVGRLVAPVDEKYKDLPGRHVQLRADFDTHAADLRLHTRQPAAPAKRARRPRSR